VKLHCYFSVLIVAFAASAASAQVYKWVDENGKTHYGQKPPEGKQSRQVELQTPSEETLQAAQERLKKIQHDILNRNAEPKSLLPAAAVPPQIIDRCDGLRRQLAAFDFERGTDTKLAAISPGLIKEAKARVAKEIEQTCKSPEISGANASVELNPKKCNDALAALLAIENPQSGARARARAACQEK
jgi:Domain of unknown function (DUF4124)